MTFEERQIAWAQRRAGENAERSEAFRAEATAARATVFFAIFKADARVEAYRLVSVQP